MAQLENYLQCIHVLGAGLIGELLECIHVLGAGSFGEVRVMITLDLILDLLSPYKMVDVCACNPSYVKVETEGTQRLLAT